MRTGGDGSGRRASEPAETDRIEVLHLDDEAHFLEMAAAQLERVDDRFDVRTATHPADALEAVADHDFDCLISDYDMPGMDGIEFFGAVRETDPDVPFILFTGKGSEEVASEAISAGVTDYLQKAGGAGQYTVLANRIDNAVAQYHAERRADERERELQRQNDLFEQAQTLATVGAWEYDCRTDDLSWTDEVARIHGLGPSYDPTVEEATEFYHPDDRPVIREAFERAVEDGDPYDVTLRLRTADGDQRWVQTTGAPQMEDGEVVVVRGSLQDVTEHKERERALEQQRRRLSIALEGADAGVWEWVPETDDVVWHETTERLFGLDAGEFDGTYEAFAEYVHEADRDRLEATIEDALAEGETYEAEFRVHTEDGDLLWIHTRAEFVEMRDLPPRYIGVATDITERKEREQDLERARNRYRTLLDGAPDAIFVADPETGEIRETNQAATRLLGRPREEIVGMDQTGLHPPEKAAEYARLFEEHVASGAALDERLGQDEDIYVVDADGERIPTEISARVVETEDGPLIQGFFRDISRRRERERELERQNERLDEFASMVSHDLRNPLRVAKGRVELASETGDLDHLADADTALDRIDDRIDTLLTIARDGEPRDATETVDLATLSEACWADLEPAETSLAIDTGRSVLADRGGLRQVLENLFRNAVENGSDRVTVGDLDDGFYVADDGPGIPEADRDRVFDAGYSPGGEGTGFGLVVVRQVAESHGWSVTATDSADGGARFEFTGVEFAE